MGFCSSAPPLPSGAEANRSLALTDTVERVTAALADRYTFERELGRGGMATVYLANDLRHDRQVALKVLHPELAAAGPDRFLREVRLTARLNHPHIVPVLDSGEANGLLWFTMPYVQGETLRDRLRREGQLPLGTAVDIARQVASALDYAHRQGLVHRDLKPENILVADGQARVADFGIAKALTDTDEGRLTATGLALGTPAYMAPEQATGGRVDSRADVYALGCVTYEMLAGEPPYTGSSAQALIAKRLSEPAPKLSVLREVPPQVEQAVTRALSRTPADRFGTVLEFVDAIAQAPAPRRLMRLRWAVVLVAGIAVLGLALLANQSRPEVLATPIHRQVTFTGHASSPALSTDHRWLSFASHKRLFVQDLRSLGAAPVSVAHAPLALWTSRWSPDGTQLFYVAADSAGFGIYVVPRQGGPSRRLAAASRFDLAPTGDLLYATNGSDSIIVLEASSGARKGGFSLLSLASTVFSPAVAPDSRWVAFAGVKGGTTFLGVARTDGSQARSLVEGVPRWGSLAWSRTGDAIYYLRDLGSGANVAAAGDVMKVGIDPRTGERRGGPVTVLGGAFVQEFFLSSDGRRLAYTKAPPQQRIWTMTLKGSAARPQVAARELTSGTSIHGTPDVSSDGQWVAFARNDGGTGNLYITPFDHYEPRPLVASPADEWSPRFSPDGRYIAYAVRDSGTSPGILVVDVAGAQVRRITSDGLAPLGVITWMPSGSEVVFPLDLGQHYAIQDIATGQRDTLLVPDSIGSFHLTVASPTGQYLVSNAGRGAAHELWIVERSGVPWKRLDKGTVRVRWPLLWTRSGWLYFLSGEAFFQGDMLWRVHVDGGPATLVAKLPQPCSGWQTALSADAHRLVCAVSKAEPDIWIAEDFDPGTQ